MRYLITKGRIGGGGIVLGPGDEIELPPEYVASLIERGCALTPITPPLPSRQDASVAAPVSGESEAAPQIPPPAAAKRKRARTAAKSETPAESGGV